VHDDVEVAGRAAALAGVPAARQADALAVGDPGGDVDGERAPADLPAAPVAVAQGVCATRPSPPQASHATWRTTWPNGERVTAWRIPEPPQRSHVSIGVPGSAPLPWQFSHGSTASKLSCTDAPVAACSSVTSAETATSAPCAGPVRAPPPKAPPNPPPKNASKRSDTDPKPSKLGPIPPDRSPSCP
jgi:hypothetical protein